MTQENKNEIELGILKLKQRKPLCDKISLLTSRYDMFTKLNNNQVDYHEFDEWVETLIKLHSDNV